MEHAIATPDNVTFVNAHPSAGDSRSEIMAGLRQAQKTINPKWFYDETGAQLFTEITRLPEYYPTRTEVQILTDNREAIARACGKSHVHKLEPEDLAALTVESAAMAKIPLAGTNWIPGNT